MNAVDLPAVLGPALASAFERKGYSELTPVQTAVLAPGMEGRDLRITSQTGSGKTLAIGFALRRSVEASPTPDLPIALVLAPTRELAQQTRDELQWLYAPLGARVITTTGGASYRDELRSLARKPTVVVGTPGRLLDHLKRGALDPSGLQAIVLDEADRMLDLGFREDIEAIFGLAPKERRTHLVSATFPPGVRSLANAVQKTPALVEGNQPGAANSDIDHVLHLVDGRDRLGAIINLLLVTPGARTLVFARTRADVAELAHELGNAGFGVSVLSGELDQAARNRSLAAFKSDRTQVLVATDVAARGIDVQDIARVIHADPPTSADAYTHRAGRTGRAGKKGLSSLLVSPAAVVPVTRVLRQAGVAHRVEPIPSAESLRSAADARVLEELTREVDAIEGAPPLAPRVRALAERLAEHERPAQVIARLLSKLSLHTGIEPRDVREIKPRERGPERARGPERTRGQERTRGAERTHGPGDAHARPASRADREARFEHGTRDVLEVEAGFARFHVSWGARHGAEPHRVLAMICRRGEIVSRDVGAIRVQATFSFVDVARSVAERFAEAAGRPDPRDPRVAIRPDRGSGPHPPSRPRGKSEGKPDQAAARSPRAPEKAGGHRPLRRK